MNKLFTKSFLERTISGIILIIIALITIISGGLVLNITLIMVSLIGLSEIYRIYKLNVFSDLWFIGAVATISWYILLFNNKSSHLDAIIIMTLLCSMALYVFEFPKISTRQVLVTVFGLIYVTIMLSYIFIIRNTPNGAYLVWLVFLCSWGSDTCAYLVGVTMGKHKMSPVLSPKKSIEGLFGGIIGAALLGLIYALIFKNHITGGINPLIGFPITCAIGSLISVIGDLAASAIKRKHNIKDYGKLIPGHGGILDRFDSVIFTAPVIYFVLSSLGMM